MKNIFYICLFLLLAVCAQAQRTVTYVSFFPPRDVAHDTVHLTQDQDKSFRMTHLEGEQTPEWLGEGANYAELPGGLILGAADESIVEINKASLTTPETTLPFAIRVFRLHNNIFVKANGQIKHVSIGGSNDIDCNDSNCNAAVISAYDVNWPLKTLHFLSAGMTFHIKASGRGEFSNLKVGNGAGVYAANTHFNKFIPKDVPQYPNSEFSNLTTHEMTANDKLEWRRLRLEGSEKCLLYLTVNAPQVSIPGADCAEP